MGNGGSLIDGLEDAPGCGCDVPKRRVFVRNRDVGDSTSHVGWPDRSPFHILDQFGIDLHRRRENQRLGRRLLDRFHRRFGLFDFGWLRLLERLQFLHDFFENTLDCLQSIGRLVR